MQDVSQFFMELLPAVAQAWIVAGIIVAGVMITGLLLLAVVIRGEDAGINLDTRPPGPIARRVRKMLNLRVYNGDDFHYGASTHRGDDTPPPPPDERTQRTQLTQPLAPQPLTPQPLSSQAPHLYYGATSRSRLF